MLLDEWLNMEASFGEVGDVSLVQSKLPKKLKKRRSIITEDGPAGYVTNSHFSFSYFTFLFMKMRQSFDFIVFKSIWRADFLIDMLTNVLELARYEEYIDYMFPEEAQTSNLKILEAAYMWKKRKVSSDDDED